MVSAPFTSFDSCERMFQNHHTQPCLASSSPRLTFDDGSTPKLPPPASTHARGHQRSRTTVERPPLFSRSPSHSPTRSSTFLPFIGSSSRSSSPKRVSPGEAAEFDLGSNDASVLEPSGKPMKTSGKVERLASWFEGASEPVNIGLVASPKTEQSEPFYEAEMAASSRPSVTDSMDNFTKRPTTRKSTASPTASTSRFSFFRKASTSQMKPDPDDLANLDIRDSLFPEGPVDEMSPAAYKNLQLNAEGMLRKFQAAYKENLAALRKATSDRNVQADELEASTTRNEHLKMQLLEMAERAAEQEKIITSLRTEAEERKNIQSIRMVGDDSLYMSHDEMNLSRRHKVRNSDASGYAGSFDSETGSEVGSSAVSIFSDAAESIRSPATSVGCPSPTLKHVTRIVSPNVVHLQHNPTLSPSPMMETYVRPQQTQVMVPECQKCHGLKSNEAWDVLGVMKMESAALKGRIAELEVANESALDILVALNLNV